jgi:hypothetical protein
VSDWFEGVRNKVIIDVLLGGESVQAFLALRQKDQKCRAKIMIVK